MRLRSFQVLAPAICAPLFAVSCTSDLPAPDCYIPDGPQKCRITGASATAGGDIAIDCEDIPNAAVLADYDYQPMISGGDGMFMVTATNLPAGLSIDGVTGRITGIPEMAGMAAVELQVSDGTGSTGSQTCEFDVNDALLVDLELLLETPPYCVRTGETLGDYIVDGTGIRDDMGNLLPVTCDWPGGSGNGNLPAGITVNPDSCEIEGTLTETRYGTYVWIVRGTQGGNEVFIPYCVTQDMQGAGEYSITVDHSGLSGMGVDGTLVPLVGRFPPMGNFSVGGGGDPRFEITDPTSCGGNACFYGFAFGINASPFNVDTGTLLDPNALLNNMAGDPIGFFHELQLDGPNPMAAPTFAEDFGDRPWLVNIALDYCIDAVEANCMDMNIRTNGNGSIEMGVVMIPE